MSRVTGITIGSAISSKDPGSYVSQSTTATAPSSGTGLLISFVVDASNNVITPLNIISGGQNYSENDTFTVNEHGNGSLMTITEVSASVSVQKFNRTYIKVQPSNLTGPPTMNLTDRDLYGSTIINPGTGITISGTGIAAEDIQEGQLVYSYDSGGSVPAIRLASAEGAGIGDFEYQMNVAGVALGDGGVGATINYARNTSITLNPVTTVVGAPAELVPGETYYLSADPATRGLFTTVPPTGRGQFFAICGTAASTTSMIVEIQSIVAL